MRVTESFRGGLYAEATRSFYRFGSLPDFFTVERLRPGQAHSARPSRRREQINAPIEPPAKFERKPADPVILKKEAEELAKLSAGVPAQVDQVSQGKFPKDLSDQLKRIEKLAKHLRSEIAP